MQHLTYEHRPKKMTLKKFTGRKFLRQFSCPSSPFKCIWQFWIGNRIYGLVCQPKKITDKARSAAGYSNIYYIPVVIHYVPVQIPAIIYRDIIYALCPSSTPPSNNSNLKEF